MYIKKSGDERVFTDDEGGHYCIFSREYFYKSSRRYDGPTDPLRISYAKPVD